MPTALHVVPPNGGIRDQLRIVKEELMQARQKLNNLLDAIGNGLCSGEDLAQRLRERKTQVATLEVTKHHLEDQLASPLPTTLKPECLAAGATAVAGCIGVEGCHGEEGAAASVDRENHRHLGRAAVEDQPEIRVPRAYVIKRGNGGPDLDKVGRAFVTDKKRIRETWVNSVSCGGSCGRERTLVYHYDI
jgi:hypothetical protein